MLPYGDQWPGGVVAVSMGVTDPELSTYAVLPSGVIAIAVGAYTPPIGCPVLPVALSTGSTKPPPLPEPMTYSVDDDAPVGDPVFVLPVDALPWCP